MLIWSRWLVLPWLLPPLTLYCYRQYTILRNQVLDKLAGQQRHQLVLLRSELATRSLLACQQVKIAAQALLHIFKRLFERGVKGPDVPFPWRPVARALVQDKILQLIILLRFCDTEQAGYLAVGER